MDEVRLVDDATRLTPTDGDEHALVQPLELSGSGLDLGGRAKGVLAGVDRLAIGQTGEDVSAPCRTPRDWT